MAAVGHGAVLPAFILAMKLLPQSQKVGLADGIENAVPGRDTRN